MKKKLISTWMISWCCDNMKCDIIEESKQEIKEGTEHTHYARNNGIGNNRWRIWSSWSSNGIYVKLKTSLTGLNLQDDCSFMLMTWWGTWVRSIFPYYFENNIFEKLRVALPYDIFVRNWVRKKRIPNWQLRPYCSRFCRWVW